MKYLVKRKIVAFQT